MQRAIVGFYEDVAGDFVAMLACGHEQHVRHKPPFTLRPWVLSADGRAGMIGKMLDCRHCEAIEREPFRVDGYETAMAQAAAAEPADLSTISRRILALAPQALIDWLNGFLQAFAELSNQGGVQNKFSVALGPSNASVRAALEHHLTALRKGDCVNLVPLKPDELLGQLRRALSDRLFLYIPRDATERSLVLRGTPPLGLAQTLEWRETIVGFTLAILERLVPHPSGFRIELSDERNPSVAAAHRFALASGDTILVIMFEQDD